MDDIDMEIFIYKYLLKRRDAIDLSHMVNKEIDLEEKERLEQELEKIEQDINKSYYSILETQEGYDKLLKIEKELRGNRRNTFF